LFLYYSW